MKKASEIICVGQAVVDCITRGMETGSDGKMRAESITLNIGGDAINEASVLKGLGRMPGLVCGLGDDAAGQLVLKEAERRGIDTSRITVMPSLVTPVADIIVEKDGSRRSVTSMATLLPGYEVDPAFFKGARAVSFASLFRAPLDEAPVIRRLVRAAKEAGAVVFADTKLPTFRALALDDIEDILPLLDYIFPNEEEAAFYSGKTEIPDMALEFLHKGVGHVVIKRGPLGCYAADRQSGFYLPGRDVKAVDTTGAGDNFAAGFIDAVLKGVSFREACEAGRGQAEESIRHIGGVRLL